MGDESDKLEIVFDDITDEKDELIEYQKQYMEKQLKIIEKSFDVIGKKEKDDMTRFKICMTCITIILCVFFICLQMTEGNDIDNSNTTINKQVTRENNNKQVVMTMWQKIKNFFGKVKNWFQE